MKGKPTTAREGCLSSRELVGSRKQQQPDRRTPERRHVHRGQQRDAETGYCHLRARQDDPAIRRFLRRDFWPGNLLQPQRLNRYVYVTNTATFVGPSGLVGEKKIKEPFAAFISASAQAAARAAEADCMLPSTLRRWCLIFYIFYIQPGLAGP